MPPSTGKWLGPWLATACLAWTTTASADPPSPLADLRFENPVLGAKLVTLDACIRAMPGPTFRHIAYQKGGNFFRARWCRGAGARPDCQIASGSARRRDQHALELTTLFYPQGFPQVFGMGLNALQTPTRTGWGMSLSFAVEGKRVVGSGLSLKFDRFDRPKGSPALSVQLGSTLSHQVAASELRVNAKEAPLALLLVLTESPESLRDRGLAQRAELRRDIAAALAEGRVHTCDYAPYRGDGRPPECTERPLTPAEQTAQGERAERRFAAEEAALKREYRAMFAAMAAALPSTCEWP